MTKVLQCDLDAARICAAGLGEPTVAAFLASRFARHREEAQAELLDELNSVLEWALNERQALRDQEIASISKAIARAKGEA